MYAVQICYAVHVLPMRLCLSPQFKLPRYPVMSVEAIKCCHTNHGGIRRGYAGMSSAKRYVVPLLVAATVLLVALVDVINFAPRMPVLEIAAPREFFR